MRSLLVTSFFALGLAGCTCAGPGMSGGGSASGGGSGAGGGSASGGGTSAPTVTGIAITPAMVTLEVRDVAVTQAYTAEATYSDGTKKDVTAQATWSVQDFRFGTFSGATFTSATDYSGVTEVRAQVGTSMGTGLLTLVLKRTVVDTTGGMLPGDAGTLFTGTAMPSFDPELVYPNDGVLVPPNLGKLEVHFVPKPNTTLFEISFLSPLTEVRVLTRCRTLANGCYYVPTPEVWEWISRTNRGASFTIGLKATDDNGSATGAAKPLTVRVSQDDIRGGLYYWTTSNGSAIMRFDFANPQQMTAQKFAGPELANNTCIGCHALSRDGKKLVAEAGGQNDGRLLILDVETKTPVLPFASGEKSIFESWDPDGGTFAAVYGDNGATDYNVFILDGRTAQKVYSIPNTGTAANPADHPDWSSDGESIAFVKVGVKETMQRFGNGAIQRVRRFADAGWSEPETVVASAVGKNRYYPAISPTNDFIVYDESTCANGVPYEMNCNADTDPSARLWAVRYSSAPVELVKVNTPGPRDGTMTNLSNSFPKWSPFVFQRTGEIGSKLLWVTFSSTRAFGLREPPGGGGENPRGTLLWMSAIDPDELAQGKDPSFPAFALPFQDLQTSNHIAQWATQVVGEPGIN